MVGLWVQLGFDDMCFAAVLDFAALLCFVIFWQMWVVVVAVLRAALCLAACQS